MGREASKMSDEKTENNESMENEQKEAVELQNQIGEKDTRKEVDKLRSDVDKLSLDLKATVTELKKSIVDIRSAVSEIAKREDHLA
jgi:peptidoglycan hydrolase CwlO-like protein